MGSGTGVVGRMNGRSLTTLELAERVEPRGLRCSPRLALSFLERWRSVGVAEEIDGRWQLSERGAAMFAGFVSWVYFDEDELPSSAATRRPQAVAVEDAAALGVAGAEP